MKTKRTFKTWVTLIGWALASLYMAAGTAGKAAAQSTHRQIVMAMIQSPTEYYGKWAGLIYAEAFRRLDMELVLKAYPIERANQMVETQQVDGDIGRSFAFHKAYPHLIRVDEFPFSMKLSAFAMDPAITVNGLESLRGTTYHVDYLRGSKLLPLLLETVVAPEKLSTVTHWVQGLKKLIAGRTDVFLEAEEIVLYYISKDEQFQNAGVHIAGVILESPAHAYLQPKHTEIAPKLSAVLRKMRNEGLIEAYQLKAVESLGGDEKGDGR